MMALSGTSARLDAHAHFFYPGFVQAMPPSCRRQSPDEITLYQAYAEQHQISQVLAIGYEGAAWANGNNAFLTDLAAEHTWVRPVAFVVSPTQLSVEQLVIWQAQHFVGVTLYIFTDAEAAALDQVSDAVWAWLADHAWLISVNSTGAHWTSWQPILSRHPQLRLLVAHLGLPPATSTLLSPDTARATLDSVCQLANFLHTYVKFSGLYALAQPNYAYPHRAAWPYAQAITEAFGASRILWASDFSPALEYVSFPQTVAVVAEMAWLTDADLAAIYHDNLAQLLAAVDERNNLL